MGSETNICDKSLVQALKSIDPTRKIIEQIALISNKIKQFYFIKPLRKLCLVFLKKYEV